MKPDTNTIIEVKNLKTQLGGDWVHEDINLSVKKGEIFGIVGGSGSGKTTLLREMLGLTQPSSGTIHIFDTEITHASAREMLAVQARWGVLFQQNALFSSLTLLENVMFPLKEHTRLDAETLHELSLLKIMIAGLPSETATKYPSELSGGMQKRAGIARAIVLDPEIIFLDEPTTGLDPGTAAGFDEMILNLQKTMGLTIVIVTHDLDTLWRIANRVAFLGNGVVLGADSLPELVKNPNKKIQAFFHGVRGLAIEQYYLQEQK